MVGSPTGGSQGSGTLNTTGLFVNGTAVATTNTGCTTGSFTGTLTGVSTTETGTFYYSLCGKTVWISTEGSSISGTSNSTSMTVTGVPSIILPTVRDSNGFCNNMFNNGIFADLNGTVLPQVASSGTLTFFVDTVTGSNIEAGVWTASGIKGFDENATCTYTVE